ncbi:MAG: NADH-quinone oxidoreductase subunit L [Anaerolineae bacterium]|nr:NADH-quinone oxidoreductase subunit L [Anaerolineae bacterium]
MTIQTLVWLIPLPPLLAFGLIVLLTHRRRKLSHGLAIGSAGVSWLASMLVIIQALRMPKLAQTPIVSDIAWLPLANDPIRIGILVDPLTVVTLFFVSWTVLMIFIYSVGYHNFGQPDGEHDRPGLPPKGAHITDANGQAQHVPSVEPMYSRFFALISLFAFGMYLLVVTDNLLTLYIGWEVMGLCSYLLIGFWYAKPSARDAGMKAFLTTRIGDVFMLLGLAALYQVTGTLNFRATLANPAVLGELAAATSPVLGLSWAGLIAILLFIGTIGKSAQFPLHVWLPDAMEGPTPVSAMIHAATMVSAGVYLMVRFFPLLTAGWQPGEALTPAMQVVATIGTFTAIFAAVIALGQNDIKRVLAYSTISQLGFMLAAVGVGSFVAAAFHLVTHAFFKALLFLGSGSVIHGMEHGVMHTGEHLDPQDMRNMGGLRRTMPLTFWTFLAGGMALAGFPLVTAGFWSKDEILAGAFNGGNWVVFVTLAVAALLTAFYTMRLITLTFLGQPRTTAAGHAQESRREMTLPLAVLAFFSVTLGWVGIPQDFPLIGGILPNWLDEFLGGMLLTHGEAALHHSNIPLWTSLIVALGGLTLGWLAYRRQAAGQVDILERGLGPVYSLIQNKFYVDELYSLVFIRPAVWVSETLVAKWIDLGILDGILHGIANFGLWLGRQLLRWIDLLVITNTGNAVASGTGKFGGWLRRFHTGRIQQYMVMAMFLLILTGVLFYALVLV